MNRSFIYSTSDLHLATATHNTTSINTLCGYRSIIGTTCKNIRALGSRIALLNTIELSNQSTDIILSTGNSSIICYIREIDWSAISSITDNSTYIVDRFRRIVSINTLASNCSIILKIGELTGGLTVIGSSDNSSDCLMSLCNSSRRHHISTISVVIYLRHSGLCGFCIIIKITVASTNSAKSRYRRYIIVVDIIIWIRIIILWQFLQPYCILCSRKLNQKLVSSSGRSYKTTNISSSFNDCI